MQRVIGVETEYGLLGRTRTGRMASSEAAQWLFRPVEAHHRSSNAFLANGGRLYLDVGAHPEYATPECRTPREVVLSERAGDDLLVSLAERASEEAAAAGTPVTLRLFKNNADSFGNSYGCHENYLVERELEPESAAALLTSFLVTRPLLCGSGCLRRGAFVISQRADHLHDSYSALTTRARPLVNSRDEPLADPARFRRLHVLAGDSNLSEYSSWLRLASTEAVLSLIERAASEPRGQLRADLERWQLADPVAALPAVARDPRALLTTQSGGRMTALDVQYAFAELVARHAVADPTVMETWLRVLDALDADDPDAVADIVEWAAKRRLLAQFRQRHDLAVDDPRLAAVDLAFHDLSSNGLARRLEAGGVLRRLTRPEEVRQAMSRPVSPTRAQLRSRLIVAAQQATRDYSVDWMRFAVHDLPGGGAGPADLTVTLGDPLASVEAAVDALAARMLDSPRVRATGGFRPPGSRPDWPSR
ncbi:MAG: proteasome accessory factor PafA2 family protein [Propionicimonas sp.]